MSESAHYGIIRTGLFDQQAFELSRDTRRFDEAFAALEWLLARNPYLFDRVAPDSTRDLEAAVSDPEPSDLFHEMLKRFAQLGGVELELPARDTPPRAADFSWALTAEPRTPAESPAPPSPGTP